MKNYIIAIACLTFLLVGVSCNRTSNPLPTADMAFYELHAGPVKMVSDIVGVKEDKTSYIVAENTEPMLISCLVREEALFSQDGVLQSSSEPVRDSSGRIISFRKGETYLYHEQELRPSLYADEVSLQHYIYKGKSVSPSESLSLVREKEGDEMEDLVVWYKRYEYIEKDQCGNWTKRAVNAYMGTLSDQLKDYYAPLCDINLSSDTRVKLEEELRQELKHNASENITVECYTETESRSIEYYE